jgi:hypothetical protein
MRVSFLAFDDFVLDSSYVLCCLPSVPLPERVEAGFEPRSTLLDARPVLKTPGRNIVD